MPPIARPPAGRRRTGRARGSSRVTAINSLPKTTIATRNATVAPTRALGIPHERIAERLGQSHDYIADKLRQSQNFDIGVESQLATGFTSPTIAGKLDLPEPLVWHVAQGRRVPEGVGAQPAKQRR